MIFILGLMLVIGGRWSQCFGRCDFFFIAASPIIVGGVMVENITIIATVVMYVVP
jgi:hypothetical protein